MVKCPYCGKEFEQPKWYFSTFWVIVLFLCLGPFALPFVWFNPRYKPITKWIVTVLVVLATIWLCIKSASLYHTLKQQLQVDLTGAA
jgi:hypothetical protein